LPRLFPIPSKREQREITELIGKRKKRALQEEAIKAKRKHNKEKR